MKNILVVLLCLVAFNLLAQQRELVDDVAKNVYGDRSYIYTGSVTLTNGFRVNASEHGAFFIRPAEAVKSPLNIPPSLNENFLRVEEILVDGVISEDQIPGLNISERNISYQYFDGAGRPTQDVSVMGSPKQLDIVKPYTYDSYGRSPLSYLPYVSAEGNGAFKSASLTGQSSFYNGTHAVSIDSRPFQEYEFELSPLSRVKKTYGAGELWKNESLNKGAEGLTEINLPNTVRRWYISTATGLPESNEYYPEGSLVCSTIITEEGYTTKTYTDYTGNVIMTDNNGLQTHYVYNLFGQLRYVLPPLLSKDYPVTISLAQPNQNILDLLAFQYKYDQRRRLTQEKGPGADNDWVYYVYDEWDRLVAKQDGAQRNKSPKEWSFVKYDELNRPVITGVLKTGISDYQGMIDEVSGGRFETRNVSPVGYTLVNSFPVTNSSISAVEVLTVTYYDDYSFRTISGWSDNNAAYAPDEGLSYMSSVKGMITGTKIKILDQSAWLNSVEYYDAEYRPVQSIQRTYLSAVPDRITNTYNDAGWVMRSERKHYNRQSSATMVIAEDYEYDHTGRLKNLYHQIDAHPRVLLASYAYNELGQLIEKNLHSINGSPFLQSVDYRYNIRGWLTSINNAQLDDDGGVTNNDSDDLFGMDLVYNEQELNVEDELSTKLYDGRISAVRWSTKNPAALVKERAYTYFYDGQQRFAKANYAAKTGTTFTDEAGLYHFEVPQYDENGNIKNMVRYASVNGSKHLVDDLTYTYADGGNQLTTVEDAAPFQQFGYPDNTEGLNPEMEYDKNGNLGYDLNTLVSSVAYNILNLPKTIVIDPNGKQYEVEYVYDATGYVWQKVLKEGGEVKKRIDYVQGIQYFDQELSIIFNAEGRVTPYKEAYEYEYFLKDHLTNTRVVFGNVHETDVYKATMETELSATEEDPDRGFRNFQPGMRIALHNHTPSSMAVTAPNESVSLNGYNGGLVIGPAKMLTVKAGDQVNMEVFARYTTLASNSAVVNNLVAAVTGAYGLVNAGETQAAYQAFSDNLPAVASQIMRKTNAPKAYLFYILFDDNYANPQFGYAAVEQTALLAYQHLVLNVTVPLDGFMYIYIANESNINAATAVYFDDFKIVHEKNTTSLVVTESTDYDPFGLMLEGTRYVDETRVANNYKYQGEYAEFDELVGWNRFSLRGNYDSRLGRWHAVDPFDQYPSPYAGMGNSFVNGTDPDGGFFNLGAAVVGAFVGGAIGAGVGYLVDRDNWQYYAIGGAAIGGLYGGLTGRDLHFTPSLPNGFSKFRAQVKQAIQGGRTGSIYVNGKIYRYGTPGRYSMMLKEIEIDGGPFLPTFKALEGAAQQIAVRPPDLSLRIPVPPSPVIASIPSPSGRSITKPKTPTKYERGIPRNFPVNPFQINSANFNSSTAQQTDQELLSVIKYLENNPQSKASIALTTPMPPGQNLGGGLNMRTLIGRRTSALRGRVRQLGASESVNARIFFNPQMGNQPFNGRSAPIIMTITVD